MSEFNQARREGCIRFGYDFRSIAEVTHLWGLSATKLPYRVCFKIPDQENALCCLLSEDGGSGWRNIPGYGEKLDDRGWREIVRIREFNKDENESAERVAKEMEKPFTRYVFWRLTQQGSSWYKFYGVFKLDVEATKASVKEGMNVCIYNRVSEEGLALSSR